MPAMMPLAIDGAAPSTTTNMIAPWPWLNRMIASGTHAIDGIVCRPVIIEPMRGAQHLARARPRCRRRAPMTIAIAKPDAPRCSVVDARASSSWCQSWSIASNTVNGDGRTYSGFQPEPDARSATRRRRSRSRGASARSRPTPAARTGCGATRPSRRRSATGVEVEVSCDGHGTPSSRRWSVIVAASVATSGESMRRGRGIVDVVDRGDAARAGSRAARRGRRGAPLRARCA